jgi:hypothetical protein
MRVLALWWSPRYQLLSEATPRTIVGTERTNKVLLPKYQVYKCFIINRSTRRKPPTCRRSLTNFIVFFFSSLYVLSVLLFFTKCYYPNIKSISVLLYWTTVQFEIRNCRPLSDGFLVYLISAFIFVEAYCFIILGFWFIYIIVFQQYFSFIVAVSFIGGGNRSTRRKPPTCRRSLTNFIVT